ELGNIIKHSYPEMAGYLNLLGDSSTASALRNYTNSLAETLEASGTSVADYEKTHRGAVSAADALLLNTSELRAKIYNSLPLINDAERSKLTSALIREIASSASQPLSAQEIVERVGEKLRIPAAELSAIQASLTGS